MSLRSNNIRILLAAALFTSVVFAPPWLAAVFAFALAARWRAWEVVAAGIFMDFLWLPTSVTFVSVESIPFATLISILTVVCLEPLRRQLLLGPGIL
ncbi:MAG: hypothetical protein AAB734_02345 [Patescibacteria group bacterium]